jgi:DNA-binding CsgD family transcriptional regulator/pimeloyl-ACP methyl ester carboxylesterase
MEPQVQYARTADGVRIACWTLGEGEPVVFLPNYPGGMLAEWSIPISHAWYERLAQRWKLIQFDHRGSGLSDRGVADLSFEAMLLDLEAVISHFGLDTFAVWANNIASCVAIAYASRNQDRVSKLIFWHGIARAAQLMRSAKVRAISRMTDDWELFMEALSHYFVGWSSGDDARRYAESIRVSITQDDYMEISRGFVNIDCTELLPSLRADTLILQRKQIDWAPVEFGRELAAAIPNSRLVLLEGDAGGYTQGDVESLWTAIAEFADDATPVPAGTNVIPFAAPSSLPASARLTPREGEILRLIAAGRTSTEISGELSLSVRTVGRHITNIYNKIGARGRADAAAYAHTHRISGQ